MCFAKSPDNSAQLAQQRAEALERQKAEAAKAAQAKTENYRKAKSRSNTYGVQSLFSLASAVTNPASRSFFTPIGGT